MEGGSSVSRSIIDEIHSSDIQGDEMAGESGVSRSIIDEHPSGVIQGDQMEVEIMVLHEVSSMNFFLGIPK